MKGLRPAIRFLEGMNGNDMKDFNADEQRNGQR